MPVPAEPGDDLILREHSMGESGAHIVKLQTALGVNPADGVYGPITRTAHMKHLGGAGTALQILYPDFGDPEEVPTGETTLEELVNRFFQPDDRAWALQVAFCESSGLPRHTRSREVSSALAVGWFQHLAKYWPERSTAAGWLGYGIFNEEANVAVAAWLYYTSGPHHWNPSRTCWEGQ